LLDFTIWVPPAFRVGFLSTPIITGFPDGFQFLGYVRAIFRYYLTKATSIQSRIRKILPMKVYGKDTLRRIHGYLVTVWGTYSCQALTTKSWSKSCKDIALTRTVNASMR